MGGEQTTLPHVLTLSLSKGEGVRPSYFDKLSMRVSGCGASR